MDKVTERVLAYKRTFGADCAKGVLADLERFCRHNLPTIVTSKDGHTDVPATFLAEGRREVYLRILAHLHADLNRNEQGETDGGHDSRTAD